MKLVKYLKSLICSNKSSKELSEEEIQKIHSDVLRDFRTYNAIKRRSNFKVITPNK